MTQEITTGVPTPFRGLRVLLVDHDTESLLTMASKLEDCSYLVTTTELATVALSILQERKDRFDLVMANFNMPEMDCFSFIKSVQLIKNFPIIVMSSDLDKDKVEEAMAHGACFVLNKPISIKKLKNVWQHVHRTRNYEKTKERDFAKGNTELGSDPQEDKVEKEGRKIANASKLPDKEQVGDSDQIKNNSPFTKLTKICSKRSLSCENDELGELKRKRLEEQCDSEKQPEKSQELDAFEALADSSHFPAAFLKLIQETDFTEEPNVSEGSPVPSKLSTGTGDPNDKLNTTTESSIMQ